MDVPLFDLPHPWIYHKEELGRAVVDSLYSLASSWLSQTLQRKPARKPHINQRMNWLFFAIAILQKPREEASANVHMYKALKY